MIRLSTDRGLIAVDSDVYTNIAGHAATNCFGVKGMTETSVKDGIVRLLHREHMTKGVFVTPSEDGSSVDIELHIAVDPGVNLTAAGESIITEVRYNVEQQTGFKTGKITVCVDGVKA